MTDNRLERILRQLVKQHTGNLIPPSEDFNARVEQVAQRLAREGVLVLVGDLTPQIRHQRDLMAREWVQAHMELYQLFAHGLFGGFMGVKAQYADNEHPTIVIMQTESIPVARMMADLILPYVAMHQTDSRVTQAELRGILDLALEQLEGTDLPSQDLRLLLDRGMNLLYTILQSPMKQVSLTGYADSFVMKLYEVADTKSQPAMPDSLPELPTQRASKTPVQKRTIPMRAVNTGKPLPPVPGLVRRLPVEE